MTDCPTCGRTTCSDFYHVTPAEKWKARAREVREEIRAMDKKDERFYVLTQGEADDLIAAALAEAAADERGVCLKIADECEFAETIATAIRAREQKQ